VLSQTFNFLKAELKGNFRGLKYVKINQKYCGIIFDNTAERCCQYCGIKDDDNIVQTPEAVTALFELIEPHYGY
jgi:hypothetical protein